MKQTWRCVGDKKVIFAHLLLFLLLFACGCGSPLSSPEEVRMFELAGSGAEVVDVDDPGRVKTYVGPYRVARGDILEVQLPVALRIISSDITDWLRPAWGYSDVEGYKTRVSDAGTITLPIISQIFVAGKTLAQIESSVINAYYPRYVVNPPMVVCEVFKYQNENERVFAVMGLVNEPGSFPYPPDVQYNLMESLAFAGGFDMVADPRYLKVYRQDANGQVLSATFGIDKKSMAKAYSVVIRPGDVIYVDHTLRTRTNQFLSDVLQIRVGADIRRTSVD